jgi:hypothetical protein
MRAAAVLILLAGAAVLTAAGAAPAASEAATALPDAAVAAATAATKLAHQTPSPGADDADGDDEPLFISPEEAAQQIAAAANPAAFADLDLPAPALVIHHGPGNVRVAREFAPAGSNDKAGRDAAAQRVLARFKTKKGGKPRTPGARTSTTRVPLRASLTSRCFSAAGAPWHAVVNFQCVRAATMVHTRSPHTLAPERQLSRRAPAASAPTP